MENDMMTVKTTALPDFEDTRTAFSHLSDKELHTTAWLFRLMNNPKLVEWGSPLALWAVKWNIPAARWLMEKTVFTQFVGGSSLLNAMPAIDRLASRGTLTILDYGAEGKESEDDLNRTLRETLRAIEFAAGNSHVPVVSTKVSGLASNALLEKVQRGESLSTQEEENYRNVVKRVESIAFTAFEKGVSIFFDAEETWIQEPIDQMVNQMMRKYNKERVVVYNTYQMYRTDRLKYLMRTAAEAESEGWMLGAKIVRGAYMEKERERAVAKGYPSPIQPDKRSADEDYNRAVRFLVDNHGRIASCNASHNAESNMLMAKMIDDKGIPRNHPHLLFSQLYGMSDNITFNLANAGYNVAKYVPYGKVEEVIPYLIRRAEENTSVTGEMSRELSLVDREIRRRRSS